MIRFVRDVDGDLFIELPDQPGWFALASDMARGEKYARRNNYELHEIENCGPITHEFGTGEGNNHASS